MKINENFKKRIKIQDKGTTNERRCQEVTLALLLSSSVSLRQVTRWTWISSARWGIWITWLPRPLPAIKFYGHSLLGCVWVYMCTCTHVCVGVYVRVRVCVCVYALSGAWDIPQSIRIYQGTSQTHICGIQCLLFWHNIHSLLLIVTVL